MLDLADYWRSHPPVHEMVAAYLGIKPTSPPPPVDVNDPSGIGAMMAQFPSGHVPVDR